MSLINHIVNLVSIIIKIYKQIQNAILTHSPTFENSSSDISITISTTNLPEIVITPPKEIARTSAPPTALVDTEVVKEIENKKQWKVQNLEEHPEGCHLVDLVLSINHIFRNESETVPYWTKVQYKEVG